MDKKIASRKANTGEKTAQRGDDSAMQGLRIYDASGNPMGDYRDKD